MSEVESNHYEEMGGENAKEVLDPNCTWEDQAFFEKTGSSLSQPVAKTTQIPEEN